MSNAFTRSTMSKEEMKERKQSLEERTKTIKEYKKALKNHVNDETTKRN